MGAARRHEKERLKDRDWDKDRDRDRGRDRDRDKDRDRDRDRDRDKLRSVRDKDQPREKYDDSDKFLAYRPPSGLNLPRPKSRSPLRGSSGALDQCEVLFLQPQIGRAQLAIPPPPENS